MDEKTKTQLKTLEAELKFNSKGLVCAVAQCVKTQRVLMVAWMNRQSIQKTLETQKVWYWSRSRKKLWQKGEQSGNTQTLVELLPDCDGDTLLVRVKQKGAACHTGAATCFYRTLTPEGTLKPTR